ncbi:hypothetical protein HRbin14_01443 [bacterium HR14]|nr:hypothetical protein HRbin14_01443 [bacterium HR14]
MHNCGLADAALANEQRVGAVGFRQNLQERVNFRIAFVGGFQLAFLR